MPRHDDTPQYIPQEIIDKLREGKGDELMKAQNSRPLSAQLDDARQKAELILDMCAERDEAKRHLRQLLHALDKMRETNGDEYISFNVAIAMLEARRYLQAPAGRDTCPIHDFELPCPSCAMVAIDAGVAE